MQKIKKPKTILLLLSLIGFSLGLNAQQVKNVQPKRIGDKIIVKYEITDARPGQKFDSLYMLAVMEDRALKDR